MIIATKSGWLIAAVLIEETEDRWRVKCADEKHDKWLDKDDPRTQLFDGVHEAESWIHAKPEEAITKTGVRVK